MKKLFKLICFIAIAALVGIAAVNLPKMIGTDNQVTVTPVENHDLTLENEGPMGYTAADFSEVIVVEAVKKKKLITSQRELAEDYVLTDVKVQNLTNSQYVGYLVDLVNKYGTEEMTITVHATGKYSVDLEPMSEESIEVDNDNKTVTLYVEDTKVEGVEIHYEKTEYSDVVHTWATDGKITLTPDKMDEIYNEVTANMTQALQTEERMKEANQDSVKALEELFGPLVKKVAEDYTVVIKTKQ